MPAPKEARQSIELAPHSYGLFLSPDPFMYDFGGWAGWRGTFFINQFIVSPALCWAVRSECPAGQKELKASGAEDGDRGKVEDVAKSGEKRRVEDREGAPGLGPEGGGHLILCSCLTFHCTPIVYQLSLGPVGTYREIRLNLHLPEISSVAGLRDRAMTAAGGGVEISQTRLKRKAWNMMGGHLGDSLAAVTDVRRQRAGDQGRTLNTSRGVGPPGPGLSVGGTR